MDTNTIKLYSALGITMSKDKKKIKPSGSDYLKVRKIVKMVNSKLSPNKPRFVGFFPNLDNVDNRYYIVTSNYELHYSKEYESFQKILRKLFPSVNIMFEHLHKSKVYFLFKDQEGIYINP